MSHYRPVFVLTKVSVDCSYLKAHNSASPLWCAMFIRMQLILSWQFLYDKIFDKVIVSELVQQRFYGFLFLTVVLRALQWGHARTDADRYDSSWAILDPVV